MRAERTAMATNRLRTGCSDRRRRGRARCRHLRGVAPDPVVGGQGRPELAPVVVVVLAVLVAGIARLQRWHIGDTTDAIPARGVAAGTVGG